MKLLNQSSSRCMKGLMPTFRRAFSLRCMQGPVRSQVQLGMLAAQCIR
jgi:hypothetical protein